MTGIRKQTIELKEVFPLFEEVLSRGESIQFKPKGESMLPLLRPGKDSVVIGPLPSQLKKYDVILYRRKTDHYVLHRINSVEDTYLCLGDNQFQYERVTADQVIGIMTAFCRGTRVYKVNDYRYRFYCYVWPTRRRLRYVCSCILCKWKKKRDV